ncbi:MAG: VWA domain-containing protein, partial [Gemmatimonadota bacterium]
GIESLDTGLLQDGTDIAGAIVTSTRRLLTEPHESKLIILLTDGAHNAQGITPRQAAEAATANGVKIYAISILGAPIAPDSGAAASEVARAQRARLEQEIETVLTQVARISEGRYFHAANQVALDSIYGEIDELATTSVALLEQTETVPVHGWFLFLAVLLICAEASVKGSRYGVVP